MVTSNTRADITNQLHLPFLLSWGLGCAPNAPGTHHWHHSWNLSAISESQLSSEWMGDSWPAEWPLLHSFYPGVASQQR